VSVNAKSGSLAMLLAMRRASSSVSTFAIWASLGFRRRHCMYEKGAPTKLEKNDRPYEHVLVASSHTPPAFWQSACVFAAVTSPAKAGPMKASTRITANIEMKVFMAFSPLRWT
jgi:hypothetical protein